MSPNGWRGRIHITARDEGEQLVLTVADDGVGFGRGADHLETAPANGVGLQNTRRRLAALYGDRARLELGRSSLGGARVELRLPLTIAS
jgi:sensor histidine kinase YesM